MKILLQEKQYGWLVQLKILQAYIISQSNEVQQQINREFESIQTYEKYQGNNYDNNKNKLKQKMVQVCYNDQIYLQNGYLIGQLLKKLIAPNNINLTSSQHISKIQLPQHMINAIKDSLNKVRKITVLKANENWDIIQEVLDIIGYGQYQQQQKQNDAQMQDQFQDKALNTNNQNPFQLGIFISKHINSILRFLYEQYGPTPKSKRNKNGQNHYSHINPYKFSNILLASLNQQSIYAYKNCSNILQFTCMLLYKAFNNANNNGVWSINGIDQCLGLLIDNGKYLKKLIKQANNQLEVSIQKLYLQLLQHMNIFQQLINKQQSYIFDMFLSLFIVGSKSSSQKIAKLTLIFLQHIDNAEWFTQKGFNEIILSEHNMFIPFIVEYTNKYQTMNFHFNPKTLPDVFPYDQDYLAFLMRFIPQIAISHYKKQIIETFNLQQVMEQLLKVFQDDIVEQSTEVQRRMLSRQVIQCIFKYLFNKVKDVDKSRAVIAFDNFSLSILKNNSNNIQVNKSTFQLSQTISLLSSVFSIIKTFLINQDSIVEKYFKIVGNYLKNKNQHQKNQIDEFIKQNLKQLYFSMKKSFPLGWFIETILESQQQSMLFIQEKQCLNRQKTKPYKQLKKINSLFDFQLLHQIAKDDSLMEQQLIIMLTTCLRLYFNINGDCYIESLKYLILLKNINRFENFKQILKNLTLQLLNKIIQINLPSLFNINGTPTINNSNLKNKQMTRFEAFGIKKKEILTFHEYHKFKGILQLLIQRADVQFLKYYEVKIAKTIKQLLKDKDNLKKNEDTIKYLQDKLLKRIKLSKQTLISANKLIEKSLIFTINPSLSNRHFDNQQQSQKYNQSQINDVNQTQSRITKHNYRLDNNNLKIDSVPQDQDEKSERSIIDRQNPSDNQFLNERKLLKIDNGQINQGDQFKSLQEYQSEKDQKKLLNMQIKQLDNSNQLKNSFLKTFTEQSFERQLKNQKNQNKSIPLWVENDQLQNFQISFIKNTKQQNKAIFQICNKIYLNIVDKLKRSTKNNLQQFTLMDRKQITKQFLKKLKIWKYLPKQNITYQLWQQGLKLIHTQDDLVQQDLIFQVLIQYAFLIFGFSKRVARIRIKVLDSFITLLKQTLKQQIQEKSSNKQHNRFVKKIVFQHKLIFNKINTKSNKNSTKNLQSFTLCFQTLNDILENLCFIDRKMNKNIKSGGIGIIEPLSITIMESVQTTHEQNQKQNVNQRQKSPLNSSNNQSFKSNEDQEEQLNKLEKILEQQQNQNYQMQNDSLTLDAQPKGIVKRYKKLGKKTTFLSKRSLEPPPSLMPLTHDDQIFNKKKVQNEKVQSKILKEKLAKRKQQLKLQLKNTIKQEKNCQKNKTAQEASMITQS